MKITSVFYPTDDKGNTVHAHGGVILEDNGVWYWFGERTRYHNWFFNGINCYSSRDLLKWKYEGLSLPPSDSGRLSHTTVAYRPKVLFNSIINRYVMFISACDGDCKGGHLEFAVADSIIGPYRIVNSCYGDGGRHIMDMTVFKDDDGLAYVFYSANTDKTGHWIDRLSSDYLSIVSTVGHPSEYEREAPCVLKTGGIYYLYYSECTGWVPNQGHYVTSSSLAGPWSTEKDFGDSTTYGSQGYCFLQVSGKYGPVYIYAGDRWDNSGAKGPGDPCDFNKCFYTWFPMRVEGQSLSLDFTQTWELNLADPSNKDSGE